MVFRNNLISMYHIFLLMVLFFNGCRDKDSITDPIDTISGIQFTFHQDVNKLYFAASVESSYDDGSLISVSLIWYGVNRENIPDSLIIQDDGKYGDIISDD